jgi:hypothetical protein
MFCVHAYLFVCEKEGRLLCESVCVCGSSGCWAESIERFIEGQAFLRLYDSAPHPPPPPPLVSKLDRRHTGRQRKRVNLLTGEGDDGGGRGAEPYEESLVLYTSLNYLWCVRMSVPSRPRQVLGGSWGKRPSSRPQFRVSTNS